MSTYGHGMAFGLIRNIRHVQELELLKLKSAILDGEIVALDAGEDPQIRTSPEVSTRPERYAHVSGLRSALPQ
jgi:hypothetical protein